MLDVVTTWKRRRVEQSSLFDDAYGSCCRPGVIRPTWSVEWMILGPPLLYPWLSVMESSLSWLSVLSRLPTEVVAGWP